MQPLSNADKYWSRGPLQLSAEWFGRITVINTKATVSVWTRLKFEIHYEERTIAQIATANLASLELLESSTADSTIGFWVKT